jgi:hypothetical protein
VSPAQLVAGHRICHGPELYVRVFREYVHWKTVRSAIDVVTNGTENLMMMMMMMIIIMTGNVTIKSTIKMMTR